MAVLDINDYVAYLLKTPFELEQIFENAISLIPEEHHAALIDIIGFTLIMNKITQLTRGLLYYNEHKMFVRVGFKTYTIHTTSKELKHFAAGRLVEGYIIEEEFLITR
jgi:hypothetical protein